MRRYFYDAQTHIQDRSCAAHAACAHRPSSRAANVGNAATAAPGDHSPAARPCTDHGVHIVELPRPATQGFARLARSSQPWADRHGPPYGRVQEPVHRRCEVAAAASRDARAASAMAADGSRAARADQVAHRGRAEGVESCRSHRTHRISKDAGSAGRLESLLGLEGANGQRGGQRSEMRP